MFHRFSLTTNPTWWKIKGGVMRGRVYHIEVDTKWLSFCKWHFEIHYLVSELLYFFFQISRRFVSKGRIDNKPALYIWSNDKLVYWGIYAWLGLDELYRREDSMIYYEWCLEEITCFREKLCTWLVFWCVLLSFCSYRTYPHPMRLLTIQSTL